MLRREIGKEPFRKSLREVIREYADRRVSLDELKSAFEKESGQNLDRFWEQWFFRTGAPKFILNYEREQQGAKAIIKGSVVQAGEPYRVEAELGIYGKNLSQIELLDIEARETPFSFEVDGDVDSVVLDPDYKIFRFTPEFESLYLLAYGTKLRVDGNFEEAVSSLKEFLQHHHNDLEGHYQLARAYQGLKDDSAALRHFQKVIELRNRGAPYSWTVAYAHLNLGKIHLARQESAAAREELRQALEYPKEKQAHDSARELLDSLSQGKPDQGND
jgi:tetratricopeptide (TPR) repeat protein